MNKTLLAAASIAATTLAFAASGADAVPANTLAPLAGTTTPDVQSAYWYGPRPRWGWHGPYYWGYRGYGPGYWGPGWGYGYGGCW